jgi:hypothetical protein
MGPGSELSDFIICTYRDDSRPKQTKVKFLHPPNLPIGLDPVYPQFEISGKIVE